MLPICSNVYLFVQKNDGQIAVINNLFFFYFHIYEKGLPHI